MYSSNLRIIIIIFFTMYNNTMLNLFIIINKDFFFIRV